MKYLLVLLMIATSVYAQGPIKADKQVICFPIKTLQKDLFNKYGEEPMFIGKHSAMDRVITAVYLNPDTGTYTVVEMDDEAGCIISIGTNAQYRLPKPKLSL